MDFLVVYLNDLSVLVARIESLSYSKAWLQHVGSTHSLFDSYTQPITDAQLQAYLGLWQQAQIIPPALFSIKKWPEAWSKKAEVGDRCCGASLGWVGGG